MPTPFSQTWTTPGATTHVVDSNVTGNVTIECWGGGGGGYSGNGYGGAGGGGYAKGDYTIAGGTQLDLQIADLQEAGLDGNASGVQDHATTGENVLIQANGGNTAQNGGGGGSIDSIAGNLLVAASDVAHIGGNGVVDAAGGGGSSGCPTANGHNASGSTGGTSAGTDSGAGGDGDISDALPGVAPGGGGGGSQVGTGGRGALGQIRISYNIADGATPPTVNSDASVSRPEGSTVIFQHTATGTTPITWSIDGGADAAKVTIDSATGISSWITPPDYENPDDSAANHTYVYGVKAANSEGNNTQTFTATVTDIAIPVNTVVPAVTGLLSGDGYVGLIGRQLTTSNGTWLNSPTFTYKWQRSNGSAGPWSDIASATSSTYTPVAADGGKFVRSQVTGTNVETSVAAVSTSHPILSPGLPLISEPMFKGFTPLTDFYGEFIIEDPPGDVSGETMPSPVVFVTDAPVGLVDWSAFSVSTGTDRTSTGGAIRVSESWCIDNTHTEPQPGDTIEFVIDGVSVTRTVVGGSTSFHLGSDLCAFKLSSPITTGEVARLSDDVSQFAGVDVLALEMDRHLSRQTIDAGADNTDAEITYSSPTADIIESGDSGKPMISLVGMQPIYLGSFHTASLITNPTHFLADLAAIVGQSGERLRIVTLLDSIPDTAIIDAVTQNAWTAAWSDPSAQVKPTTFREL